MASWQKRQQGNGRTSGRRLEARGVGWLSSLCMIPFKSAAQAFLTHTHAGDLARKEMHQLDVAKARRRANLRVHLRGVLRSEDIYFPHAHPWQARTWAMHEVHRLVDDSRAGVVRGDPRRLGIGISKRVFTVLGLRLSRLQVSCRAAGRPLNSLLGNAMASINMSRHWAARQRGQPSTTKKLCNALCRGIVTQMEFDRSRNACGERLPVRSRKSTRRGLRCCAGAACGHVRNGSSCTSDGCGYDGGDNAAGAWTDGLG